MLALPIIRFLETMVPESMGAVRLTLDWRVLTISAVIAVESGLTFLLVHELGWTRI